MILIVGLGNPGRRFQKTRHNLGFRVVDEFKKENNFPRFKLSQEANALISQGIFERKKIILAKPQTFMNSSGEAIKKLIMRRKLPIANLWLIHDEIDLSLGKIKIVKNRGGAGHKGVQSVINELGTKNFVRFRIGIGRENLKEKRQKLNEFLLEKFRKEEETIIKEVIKRTTRAIKMAIIYGLEKAMTEFNK